MTAKLLLFLTLMSLSSCGIFLSRGEREVLRNGEPYEVKVRKEKARTWRTELPGVGNGEIVKGKLELDSDSKMRIMRSSQSFSRSRAYYSRAEVAGDSCFGFFAFQKTTITDYNSDFKRKVLNTERNESRREHYSSTRVFRMDVRPDANESGRFESSGYTYYFLSPMFQPVFKHSKSNRIMIYRNGLPVGRIRVKDRKNKVLVHKKANEDDKRYVLGFALSVKKSALSIPK